MRSKFLYGITSLFLLITLLSCELFTEGYGDKADLQEPQLTIDGANGEYKSGTFTLSGTATDDKKLDKVEVTFTSPVDNLEKTFAAILDKGLWSISVDTTDTSLFKNQEIDLFVTAKDKAGKSTSQKRLIYIDNIKPTVLVTTPAVYVGENFNDKISVTAITADNYNVSSVKVELYSAATNSVVLAGNAVGPSEWTFDLDTLSTQETSSGQFYLMVTATDLAGLENSYFYHKFDVLKKKDALGKYPEIDDLVATTNRTLFADAEKNTTTNKLVLNIDQQSDYPKISISNWNTTGMNNFDNNIFLTGQITDDDNIATVKVTIKKNGAVVKEGVVYPQVKTYNLNINLEDSSWSGFTFPNAAHSNIFVSEGNYEIIVTASDINSSAKTTNQTVLLGVDKDAPTVTIDSPLNDSFFNTNSVTISGTATDDVTISSLYLYINGVKESIPVTVNGDGTWSKSIDISAATDKFIVKAEAIDGVSKSSYETINIFKDTIDPVIKNVIGDTGALNGIITISGNVEERNADTMSFTLNGTPIDPANTVVTALGWDVRIDTTKYPNGIYNLVATAIDRAGNSHTHTSPLVFDQSSDSPVVTFKTPSQESGADNSFKGSVNLWIEFSDDDEIHSSIKGPLLKGPATQAELNQIIYIEDITDPLSPVRINLDISKIDISDKNSEDINDPVVLKYSFTNPNADDGDFRIVVNIKDYKSDDYKGANGSTSVTTTKTLDFSTDTKGPVLTVDSLKDSDGVVDIIRHVNNNFTIIGTANDSRGNVTSIEGSYEISGTVHNFTINQGNGSWSQLVDVSSISAGNDIGVNFKVQAFDNAGNSSSTIEKNIQVDKLDPIEDPSLITTSTGLNGVVKLTGTIDDIHLENIQIRFNGGTWLDFNTESIPVKSTWTHTIDTRDAIFVTGNNTMDVRGIDKAGNKNSTPYTLEINQNYDKPGFQFDLPLETGVNNQITDTTKFSGSISDDDGVDSSTVKINLYNQDGGTDYLDASLGAGKTVSSSGRNVTWSIDPSLIPGFSQGVYKLEVVASDDLAEKLGGDSIVSATSTQLDLSVDNGAPEIKNLKFEMDDSMGNPQLKAIESINYINKDITIKADAEDGLGIQSIEYTLSDWDPLNKVTIFTKIPAVKTKTQAIDELVSLGDIKAVGNSVNLLVKVEDEAGNSVISSIPIIVDETGPDLKVNSPIDGQFNSNQTFTISGTVNDLGIGLDKLSYTVTKEVDDSSVVSGDITVSSLTWDETIDLGTEEGNLNFDFIATDKLGNDTVIPTMLLKYDKEDPSLTVSGSTDKVLTNTSVDFSGEFGDTNRSAPVKLTLSIDGGAPIDIISTQNGLKTNSWNYTFNQPDGDYSLEFKVTDGAGREKPYTRSVMIDSTAPEKPVFTSIQPKYIENTLNITGTGSDATSGIGGVEYRITPPAGSPGAWIDVDGLTDWYKNIDIKGLPVGKDYKVEVRAYDKVVNALSEPVNYSSLEEQLFSIDRAAPVVTFEPPTETTTYPAPTSWGTSRYEGGVVNFKATVTDDVSIGMYDHDGDIVTPQVENITYRVNSGAEIHTTVSDLASGVNITPTDQGVNTIYITARDAFDRESVQSVKFSFDSVAPTLDMTNFKNDPADVIIDGSSFTILGTADGTGSSIDKVEYFDGVNWVAVSGKESWSLDLTGLTDTTSVETMKFRATDIAGNTSVEVSVAYQVSTSIPTITPNSSFDTFKYFNDVDFKITGTASDGNGIASVLIEASTDGGSSYTDITETQGTTWSSKKITADGVYDIKITVKDSVGKEKTVSRRVGYDTKDIVLNITTPTENENIKISSYKISGTVTDNGGNGPQLLQYSRDDANYIDIATAPGIPYSWELNIPIDNLTEGSKTLYVKASDGLNGVVKKEITFYTDTNPPSLDSQIDITDDLDGVRVHTNDTLVYINSKDKRLEIKGNASDVVSYKHVVIEAIKDGIAYDLNGGSPGRDIVETAEQYSHVINLDGTLNGEWVYTITAYDNAGNSTSLTKRFYIDETAPNPPVTTITGFWNNSLDLTGSASDSDSGIEEVKYSLDSTNWFPLTGKENWYGSIDISGVIDEGVKSIEFKSFDRAGNESSAVAKNFTIDRSIPDSGVPSMGATVNKLGGFLLSGTATDGYEVTDVEIWGDRGLLFKKSETDPDAAIGTINPSLTSADLKARDWSVWVIPSTEGVNTISVKVTDMAGRYDTQTTKFFYDKNIPGITVNNPPVNNLIGQADYTFIGGATDSGSGVILVKYSYTGTPGTWLDVDQGSESWNHKITGLTDSTGNKIYFKSIDRAGRESAPAEITYTVDRNPPTIGDIKKGTDPIITNYPLNAETTHVISVQAKDNLGIQKVEIELPNGTIIGATDQESGNSIDAFHRWDSAPIDVSTLANGSSEWIIRAFDNSGQKSEIRKTFFIDKDKPTVTHLSPNNVDYLNGDVKIKGLANDTGSGLAKLEYFIGKGDPTGNWVNIPDKFSWEIDLSGSSKIDNYANSTYANDANGDNIWELPIRLRATDNAGNILTETATDYVVLVNPDGDKPLVQIVYPSPLEPDSILGGTMRLFGTATDDDAVDFVEVQIDSNGDGSFSNTDITTKDSVNWYERDLGQGNGQLANGSSSWNIEINKLEEFNPVNNGGISTISFRVRAVDIYGLAGPWSTPKEITIDESVPEISSLSFEQGGSLKPYTAGMWISGDWNITGSVTDDTRVDSVEIKVTLDGSTTTYTEVSPEVTANANNYDFAIPVFTPINSVGALSITVKGTDEDNNNSQIQYNLNYDNQAPLLNSDKLSKTKQEAPQDGSGKLIIEQSNNSFEIKSSVDENGSGFERIVYYFTREGGVNPRVIVPDGTFGDELNLAPFKQIAAFTPGLEPTVDDPFYRESITGAVVDREGVHKDGYFTLSNPQFVGPLVRKGGLIKVEGLYYRISEMAGTTITLNDATLSTAIGSSVDVQVVYGLVVDNTVTETPVRDGSNNLISITNDDGDGLVEVVEREGGTYNWTSSINSHAIPDGPVKIYWVAFDKAGNVSSDSMDGMVLNNRPRLASVTLGTDLNGNGSIANVGEVVEIIDPISLLDVNSEAQAIVTAASQNFVAKDDTSVDLEIIGGNGELQYKLTNGASTVSGHNMVTLRADAASPVQTIVLTDTQLKSAAIGDGLDIPLLFTIWDSTEDTTIGVDSQFAELTLPIDIDAVDDVSPYSVVYDMFWNSDSDNSLFGNNRSNGHIELLSDSNGVDIDISGKVVFRGTVYDDQRIVGIKANLPGASNINLAGLDAGNNLIANSGANWTMKIDKSSFDQTGHRVDWTLSWDSNSFGAGNNQSLEIIAVGKDTNDTTSRADFPSELINRTATRPDQLTVKDSSANYDTLQIGLPVIFENGDRRNYARIRFLDKANREITLTGAVPTDMTSYKVLGFDNNRSSLSFDVVPYITSIDHSKPFTGRLGADDDSGASLGDVPLFQGDTGITVKGFNLPEASEFSNADTTFTIAGTDITLITTIDRNSFTFNVPAALTSGSAVVKLSGVDSINNSTLNDTKEYNLESGLTNNRSIYIDSVEPTISIAPFGQKYSDGDSDSVNTTVKTLGSVSDYEDNIAMSGGNRLGYVEYKSNSTYGDIGTDADVSGRVIFRGKAYDNQRIKSIKVNIPGFNGNADFEVYSASTITDNANPDKGKTEGAFNTNSNWEFRAESADNILTNSRISKGHVMNWEFEFNTSAITDIAQENTTITFKIEDFNNSALTGSDNITVDIAPYITSVLRSVGSEGTIRSRFGRNVVYQGETDLVIKGFNLGSTAATTVGLYAGSNATTTPTTAFISPVFAADSTQVTVDIPATAKSGAFKIYVNGVESINNKNNNAIDYNKNIEVGNNSSVEWRDDKYLFVWEQSASFNNSESPIYPAMTMDSSNNLLASWTNYGQSAAYIGTSGSRTRIFTTYDPPEYTDTAYDGSNQWTVLLENFVGGTSSTEWGRLSLYRGASRHSTIEMLGDDTINGRNVTDGIDEMLYQFKNPRIAANGNGVYVSYYDDFSKSLKYAGIKLDTSAVIGNSLDWSGSVGTSSIYETITVQKGHSYKVTILDNEVDNITYNGNARVGLIGDISGLTYVGTTSTANELEFYATMDETVEVRIRRANSDSGTSKVVINDHGLAVNMTSYGNYTNSLTVVDGDDDLVNPITTTSNIGEFSAIDIDGDIPVIVYYDTKYKKLKYARGQNSIPRGSSEWTIGDVTSNGSTIGEDVSMKIDSSKNLHISAYKVTTGDLVYIKGTYNAGSYTFTETKVDTVGAVGKHSDLTLNGYNPIITYLDMSNAVSHLAIKYAYLDTAHKDWDGTVISDWEYMNVTTTSIVNTARTSLEYKGGSDWLAAVGFASTNYDYVRLKAE